VRRIETPIQENQVFTAQKVSGTLLLSQVDGRRPLSKCLVEVKPNWIHTHIGKQPGKPVPDLPWDVRRDDIVDGVRDQSVEVVCKREETLNLGGRWKRLPDRLRVTVRTNRVPEFLESLQRYRMKATKQAKRPLQV
jgi:hypothetical protein